MKLNDMRMDLFHGQKVTLDGKVYWANLETREVYCHSEDEEILGSISGYKVADITDDWNIKEIEEEEVEMKEVITAESFGAELPENWEAIAAHLNKIIAERGIADDADAVNDLWDEYWSNLVDVQFCAGEGRKFDGVNYLLSKDGKLYAEVKVPEGASDDYGYLTMVRALKDHSVGYRFWYDGQEDNLADDADADCEVYVEVE